MILGNIDSFAMEACIYLRKIISPFSNLFQRQELECWKIFYVWLTDVKVVCPNL